MQLSFDKHNRVVILTMLIVVIAVASLFTACETTTPPPPEPPDDPPEIALFDADSTVIHQYDNITFSILATDDKGIDSAVVDYGDGGHRTIIRQSSKNLSAGVTRQFGTVGFFSTNLTVYDTKRQSDYRGINVMVYPRDTLNTPASSYKNIQGH